MSDDGKLVVTVEDAEGTAMSDTLIALHRVPRVLAATLAYEHCGVETATALFRINRSPEIPCEEAQSRPSTDATSSRPRRSPRPPPAGISIPALAAKKEDAAAPAENATAVRWDKAACRFCGTGCSVLVGVQNGRVVATRAIGSPGQSRPELHQGLLPVQDHVRRGPPHPPAAAHEGRQVQQGRRVPPITWNQAFDIMAEKWKTALKDRGRLVAMFGSGQWTIWEATPPPS